MTSRVPVLVRGWLRGGLVAGVCLVAVVVVSGCGGDGGPVVRSTATTSPPVAVPVPVDVPVVTIPLSDPAGSPVPSLVPEADPGHADAGIVRPSSRVNSLTNSMSLASWRFAPGDGPSVLEWTITDGDGGSWTCQNCFYLPARLQGVVSEVLGMPIADHLDDIMGWEPARTQPGDYAGNGWQVEFVFGADADGGNAAQGLVTWLMGCPDGTCTADVQRVSDVVWNNRLWSSAGCGQDMATVAAQVLYPGYVAGSSAAGDRDAGIDRVIVASPAYRPMFENRNGALFMSSWQSTGCDQ